MGVRTWSDKELKYLDDNYLAGKDLRVIAAKLGKPYSAVKAKTTARGLCRGREHLRKWSLKMDLIMMCRYPNNTIPSILPLLTAINPSITESSIAGRAFKLKLHKSEQFKFENGKNSPAHKLKTWGITRPKKGQSIPGSEKTRFKKGNKPHCTLHDLAITTRHAHKDRKSPPYQWIRISEGKWIMLHVYYWEKKNGPVPKGHIIVFKDGNTLNNKEDCSNYECITKADNMKRNTIHNLPEPIKEVKFLQAQLTRTINKKSKKKNEQGS